MHPTFIGLRLMVAIKDYFEFILEKIVYRHVWGLKGRGMHLCHTTCFSGLMLFTNSLYHA